jgi:hypothetical protein
MKRPALVGSVAFLLSGLCCFSPARADPVFECRDASGRVTNSTVPCSVQSGPAPSENDESNYETFYGGWRGQAQFKQTASSGSNGTPRLLTPLTLMIDPGGKVTGSTQDSGCRIIGVARPGPLPTEPALDLTVSSCKDRVFNLRYTGSLALYVRQRYAAIHLVSMPRPVVGTTYDISATLQR